MGFTFKRLFLATVLLCSLLYLSLPNLVYAEDKATTEQTNISNPASDADAPSGPNVEINTDVEKVEIETPASVTGERIQGTGTVTDFSTSGSKAFYTIRDSSQVFHLIIDMDKTENNVYFLTDVKKTDLANQNQIEPKENNTPPPAVEPVEPDKEGGNGSFLILVLIGAVIAVVAYYFRVIKKKQGQSNAAEDEMDEDYEDEDVFEDDKKDSKEIKDK